MDGYGSISFLMDTMLKWDLSGLQILGVASFCDYPQLGGQENGKK